MNLRLRQNKEMLPDGCQFTEPKTGKVFDPYTHGTAGVVYQIITHRLANQNLFPPEQTHYFDPKAVTQEVYENAAKVRPELFAEYNPPVTINGVLTSQIPTGKCTACGSTEFVAEYCPTCGGGKLVGYRCKVCQLPKQ